MQSTRDTVPGIGTIHHFHTRSGHRFGVLIRGTTRTLVTFSRTPDPDRPTHTIILAADEADQLAELLHSTPLADRVATLERRLTQPGMS